MDILDREMPSGVEPRIPNVFLSKRVADRVPFFVAILRCKNAEGHKVDYSKLDEYDEFDEVENFDAAYKEELSKFDCGISFGMDGESEVIIENAKFKVISIEDDELYGKRDEDGAPGIRIINVEMIK